MAISAKTLVSTVVPNMLDAICNRVNYYDVFYCTNSVGGLRGTSSVTSNYYAAASGTSVALSGVVLINVDAASIGTDSVVHIRYKNESTAPEVIPNTIETYFITLSPAEEFTYAGTITITSATISISTTMA